MVALAIALLVFSLREPTWEWQWLGSQRAGVARSREFWYLFMALSGDASAGIALAGTMEHALDEPVGVGH